MHGYYTDGSWLLALLICFIVGWGFDQYQCWAARRKLKRKEGGNDAERAD